MHFNPRYRPTPHLLKDRSARVVSDRYSISKELAERDRWYQEHGRVREMYQWLGGVIPSNTTRHYAFSAQKGRNWADPSSEAVAQMRQALFALAPAIEVIDVLQNHSAASYLELMERDVACALLGWHGRLIAANKAFVTLANSQNTVFLSNGYVKFFDIGDQDNFSARLIARAKVNSSFLSQCQIVMVSDEERRWHLSWANSSREYLTFLFLKSLA